MGLSSISWVFKNYELGLAASAGFEKSWVLAGLSAFPIRPKWKTNSEGGQGGRGGG